MKTGIGYLFVGALAFCFALIWNDGIALAGLPDLRVEREQTGGNRQEGSSGPFDLIVGITSLTEGVAGNLTEVTGTARDMLEQTVETTIEAPAGLANGVAELFSADEALLSADGLAAGLETITNTSDAVIAPVTNAVETIVNGTTDIAAQIGATVDEALSSTVRILPLPLPLPTAEEETECAGKSCQQIETPRPLEGPTTLGEPSPENEPEPVPESISETISESIPEPELEEAPDVNNDGHLAPDDGLEVKPERDGAETVREDDPEPRETPVTGLAQEVERASDVAVPPDPEQKPVRSTKDEPSPKRNNAIPNAVPSPVTNAQTQSVAGHGGCQNPKISDAILAEISSMQSSGRRIYAKNTKQLITKRGNEPPTPPPKRSFFSNANEPMRKRSAAHVKKNRRVAPYVAGSGSAIWYHRSPRY